MKEYSKNQEYGYICVPTPALARRFGLEIIDETETSYTTRCLTCGHVKEVKKKPGGEIALRICKSCDNEQKKKNKESIREFKKQQRAEIKEAIKRNSIDKDSPEYKEKILNQLYNEEEKLLIERRDTTTQEYNRITTEINNIRMKIQKIIKDPDTHIEHVLPSMIYPNNIPGIIPV